jgi:UPF0755 protein
MKSFFILFLAIFFLIFIFEGIFLPKDSLASWKIFEIQKGEGFLEISTNLEKEKIIREDLYFNLFVLLTGNYKKLQAGKYLVSPSMTIPEIAKKFVLGNVIEEKITIIEGWNLKEIADFFEKKGICKRKDFFEITKKDFSTEFDFLKDKPKELSLEGYLFPDTYYIKPQEARDKREEIEDIVRKMLKNFDRKLNQDLREEIKRQGRTIFEIVNMASMLEKEVKSFEDKKLVSGILWKRLEKGIPLQVDATITYITGKKTIKIPKEDLEIDSPYNTYKYKGLPLGPICNPGLESILAAIYPEESEYWYYLSIPSGKTIFSKTLKEHNLAKAKYLK